MRVLLDTNVLATSIVGANLDWKTPPAHIWRCWQDKQFHLLISEHVMVVLDKTLDLPWFVARIKRTDRDLTVGDLFAFAEMIDVVIPVTGVASHPADDLILSAAVSGNAGFLVTGDAEFRRVGEYRGVQLRTPREFLSELDSTPESG